MGLINKYTGAKGLLLICILWLFSGVVYAQQVKHKQLRKEILESQKEKELKQTDDPKARNKTHIFNDSRKVKTLEPLPPVAPVKSPLDRKNARLIYLENADLISFDQMVHPDIQVLRGNVRFRHDDATLDCDSAYFYKGQNSVDAYGDVKIIQGDTLFVYGDKLYYNGETKLARLRGKVKMINRETTLVTDSMNYDRTTQLAYYFTGGKIYDPENTLTSVWGQYSTATENAVFRNDVKLVNENFVMNSDTLVYNTKSRIANLVGQTHIVYKDETNINTNRGWYNTETERSMLLNRSEILNKEGKYMTGDTIFYDKLSKYGEAFGGVVLRDTVQKSTLKGNYVYYNENSELGIATDSALLIEWSDREKPMYVHADTLETYKDSVYNMAKAWHDVRFYREDVQGVTDSLLYSSRDSVINLLRDPVIWQESQQLSSKTVHIYIKNQKPDKILLKQDAFSLERVDSMYFNQISGKDVTAYMDSGQLKQVEVNGNAQTIYFARDDADSTLIGFNKTESSVVMMYFADQKIEHIRLTAASEGTFYPLTMAAEDAIFLPAFFFFEEQRPFYKEEVFMRFPKKPREKFAFRTSRLKPLLREDLFEP